MNFGSPMGVLNVPPDFAAPPVGDAVAPGVAPDFVVLVAVVPFLPHAPASNTIAHDRARVLVPILRKGPPWSSVVAFPRGEPRFPSTATEWAWPPPPARVGGSPRRGEEKDERDRGDGEDDGRHDRVTVEV